MDWKSFDKQDKSNICVPHNESVRRTAVPWLLDLVRNGIVGGGCTLGTAIDYANMVAKKHTDMAS